MFWQVTKDLLEGFGTTLELFGFTLLFALPLGLIISFGSMSRFTPVKWLVKTFVWIIRGTPLMLQMIIIYYGPGLVGTYASQIENPGIIMSWLATWSVFDRFVAVLVALQSTTPAIFLKFTEAASKAFPSVKKRQVRFSA